MTKGKLDACSGFSMGQAIQLNGSGRKKENYLRAMDLEVCKEGFLCYSMF